jgi:hypothetical protein
MNSLLTTLIDIVRFSAAFSEPQDTLRVASVHDILADICSKHLSEEQIDQLADAIVACAEGQSEALPNLDEIEPALSGADVDASLVRASAALNELLALRYALRSSVDRPARLNIASAHFFDYLQELYSSSAPDHPGVVLVGALLPVQEKVDVRLDPSNRLLKRIAISYDAHTPHPYLKLRLWSASKTIHAQAERQDWCQKDGPAYDLNLWSRYDDQSKGEIRTRLIVLPYAINEGYINMNFDSIAGLELRETSVLDGYGNILVTCLRVTRQASP